MSQVQKLVFDLGLNNGDDSAYYLHLGYRVVGVEANPLLASQCSKRFEREIRAGQMTVVNAGILKQPGEFTFYRCLREDRWSTFNPDFNSDLGECEKLKVSCITVQQLIKDYGQPFFIKVDLEGAEFQVLEMLTAATAPAYISLEFLYTQPFLERLVGLGYSAFKFVDGLNFYASPPILKHQIGWRILRKLGTTFPVFHAAMCRLPQRLRPKQEWNPAGQYSPDGYAFTYHCSGPFGEQAYGSWMAADVAARRLKWLEREYRTAGMTNDFYWDVHARHSSASEVSVAA